MAGFEFALQHHLERVGSALAKALRALGRSDRRDAELQVQVAWSALEDARRAATGEGRPT